MTRGLFLRADTDSKTATAVWRRVMGVLCGRYPAWQLDSFTCIDEETEPEGATRDLVNLCNGSTLNPTYSLPGLWLRGRSRARDHLRL